MPCTFCSSSPTWSFCSIEAGIAATQTPAAAKLQEPLLSGRRRYDPVVVSPTRSNKKKRQNVRRHYRPSLGRYVETYDRKGEHARLKERQSRDAEADLSDVKEKPRAWRATLVSAGLFVVVLTTIAMLRGLGSSSSAIDYEILAARRPIVVKLDSPPASRIVLGSRPERDALLDDAVSVVRAAVTAHPDRLIVIDPRSPAISFNGLGADDQQLLREDLGSRAADRYESAVAGLLERVVDSVHNGRVTVLGLPVEHGEAGKTTGRGTNHRYRGVLRRLDYLASSHVFFRSRTTLGEAEMVREAMPEALSRRGDRPVVFRQNVTWRVVVNRGHADLDQDARSLVVQTLARTTTNDG